MNVSGTSVVFHQGVPNTRFAAANPVLGDPQSKSQRRHRNAPLHPCCLSRPTRCELSRLFFSASTPFKPCTKTSLSLNRSHKNLQLRLRDECVSKRRSPRRRPGCELDVVPEQEIGEDQFHLSYSKEASRAVNISRWLAVRTRERVSKGN